MPLLEEIEYMPTEKYAKVKELLKHSRIMGEKFDLYSHALFQTESKEMRWNEAEEIWIIHTARGDKIKSRFIIPAAGPLHRPKLLGAPSIEDFKGHAFHSSRWDFDNTGGDTFGGLHKLKDKRVRTIGTGSTAMQMFHIWVNGLSSYTSSNAHRYLLTYVITDPPIQSGSNH
jgi:cation diffusion facilitator CzcD-associated flavoprotein CzcO